MILKRKIKRLEKTAEVAEKKITKSPKGTKNSLPADTYKEEIAPKEIVVDDTRKIVISVKRGGDLGLVCADIRQYQTTQTYTGFTKKGINVPLDTLVEIKATIQDAIEECEDKGLFDD